jgi:uncharacterized membrane protein
MWSGCNGWPPQRGSGIDIRNLQFVRSAYSRGSVRSYKFIGIHGRRQDVTYRAALGLIVLLAAISTGAQRAQAGLRFCNNSPASIDVAIGYINRDRGWVSEGWWVIDGGECKNAIGAPLGNRYYYYYAKGRDGSKFSGKTPFCIETKAFTLYQAQYGKNTEADCAQAGLQSVMFRALDVEGAKNHTVNLGSPAPSAGPAPQVVPPPAPAGGNMQPPPYQPQQPPPAATGGGGGGAACQRYPNLC